jgi:hypothetical protein
MTWTAPARSASALLNDLVFDPGRTEEFENAMEQAALHLPST